MALKNQQVASRGFMYFSKMGLKDKFIEGFAMFLMVRYYFKNKKLRDQEVKIVTKLRYRSRAFAKNL